MRGRTGESEESSRGVFLGKNESHTESNPAPRRFLCAGRFPVLPAALSKSLAGFAGFDSVGIVRKKDRGRMPSVFFVERMMGIEPTRPAWEAGVLPLNYTREQIQYTTLFSEKQEESDDFFRLFLRGTFSPSCAGGGIVVQ